MSKRISQIVVGAGAVAAAAFVISKVLAAKSDSKSQIQTRPGDVIRIGTRESKVCCHVFAT